MDGLGFRQLIHKHFHIPGMVRHIGSRTGITRIQNIAHNVGLVSACHKENQLLGIKKQTAGQEYLLSSFHPYEVSVNPYNGQKRIAMTGCLLFNAKQLIFFVTGRNKSNVVRDILDSGDTGPAAYVAHHAWNVEVFMDELAKPQPIHESDL